MCRYNVLRIRASPILFLLTPGNLVSSRLLPCTASPFILCGCMLYMSGGRYFALLSGGGHSPCAIDIRWHKPSIIYAPSESPGCAGVQLCQCHCFLLQSAGMSLHKRSSLRCDGGHLVAQWSGYMGHGLGQKQLQSVPPHAKVPIMH